MAWGVWRIPEDEVGALGDAQGKDVLELGCGAAQWSIALARDGARPIGLDVSGRQLAHAAELIHDAGARVPLVQASAEELPFADASFDLVFCDHGAMSFADPHRTVPEAARVLRPGGLLAFCTDTPFHFVCWNERTERVGRTLQEPYFDMRTAEDEATTQFQLPYGQWIRLFRAHGLEVDDLIELRPPEDATTSYRGWVPLSWARSWPAEQIWRARKV
jgi:ubiquinone/menaquinone biosynthesis C-methylase UbiE